MYTNIIKKFLISLLTICITFAVNIKPSLADSYINFILLSDYSITMNIGDFTYLSAITSNGKRPTYKSSNSSIASINAYGKIVAKKSGEVTITVKASQTEAYCTVKILKTTITLNKTSISMDCGRRFRLIATTSNNSSVKWKIDKRSIASIDSKGYITAKKPGTAIVTVTAGDSSVTFRVEVKKPTIKLNRTRITLNPGQRFILKATISSGKAPTWKSTRKSIATINNKGMIKAIKPGITIISASVDGTTKDCYVVVE